MTQTAAPKVPWIITFQRKDLLTACWGSEKEANLLYHFLNKASWEAKNNKLESCKIITFHETHDEILQLVPMAEGTLIKYLKRFNLAGYVSSGRYGNTFTVNTESIRAAFANPPEKPLSAPRGRPKGFKVSRIKKTENSETLENNAETSRIIEEKSEVSRFSEHEEVSTLKEKVLSLELEVLSLKEKVLILEHLVLSLKLFETREATPEAVAEAKVSPQNDIEMIQNDIEIEGTYSGESTIAAPGTDVPTHALVSHPEHKFLWFDDLMAPTIMVIRFTPSFPHPYFSEIEDKRRGHIADEIMWPLEQRGLKIATRSEHETAHEAAIVDASQDEPYIPERAQSPVSQQSPDRDRKANGTQGDNFNGHSDNSNHSHGPADPGSARADACRDTQPAAGNSRGTTTPQQQPATGTDQTAEEGHAAGSTGLARTGSAGNGVAELSTLTGGFPQASAKVEGKGRRGKSFSQDKSEQKAEPSAPPVCPPPDAEWKTTTCLQLFDFWRGAPLLAKHQIIKASQCAKALASNYSRQTVEDVRAYMAERDPWWSEKPEAVDVCTVAENIHKKLAEMQRANGKKPSQSKRVPTRAEDPYSIAALLEEQNPGYHARKAEMEAPLWIN